MTRPMTQAARERFSENREKTKQIRAAGGEVKPKKKKGKFNKQEAARMTHNELLQADAKAAALHRAAYCPRRGGAHTRA